ncbi:hypothetical protein HDE_07893 [Halotydeus destructor]|nr:hypothetical protein HDE_07893 [Halotydeus destructor]
MKLATVSLVAILVLVISAPARADDNPNLFSFLSEFFSNVFSPLGKMLKQGVSFLSPLRQANEAAQLHVLNAVTDNLVNQIKDREEMMEALGVEE